MSETVKARNRNTMKEAKSKAERIGFVPAMCLWCELYLKGCRKDYKCQKYINIFNTRRDRYEN